MALTVETAVHPLAAEQLLARRVEDAFLFLREVLVRGDENMKARQLLECIPYWVQLDQHPQLWEAMQDQREMTAHAVDQGVYREYYGSNPYDRPMEEQYRQPDGEEQLTVENAHLFFPRLAHARVWLAELHEQLHRQVRVIDLSGNDGLMAANLQLEGHKVDVLDLDGRCVERARKRGLRAVRDDFRTTTIDRRYDVAILFETLEHMPDPVEALKRASTFAKVLLVSTPLGATERLNLPEWWRVEPKGHLWSFSGMDFQSVILSAGLTGDTIHVGPDMVMVTRLERA